MQSELRSDVYLGFVIRYFLLHPWVGRPNLQQSLQTPGILIGSRYTATKSDQAACVAQPSSRRSVFFTEHRHACFAFIDRRLLSLVFEDILTPYSKVMDVTAIEGAMSTGYGLGRSLRLLHYPKSYADLS